MPSMSSRVCSEHFEDYMVDRSMRKVQLKQNAVPTKFPAYSLHLQKVHFHKSKFEQCGEKTKLKQDAVPTLFISPNLTPSVLVDNPEIIRRTEGIESPMPNTLFNESENKSSNHTPPVANSQSTSNSRSQHAYNQNSPAHTPSSGGSPGVHSPNTMPQASQPVEINHATNYVYKIKNRFQGQPHIYKQFLEILHTYQKEERNLKYGVHTGTKPLTEAEVYAQVSKLFQNHDDLIEEFGQFLPDANGASNALAGLSSNHTPPVANIQSTSKSQSQHAYNKNSSAHTQSSGGSPGVHSPNTTPQASQSVEFNNAINYVYKIKNCFQGQPDIYKQFLEILHTYQKEERNIKYGVHTGTKPLTKAEVYAQVSKLFQNHDDLLQEFGQFLPDANGASNALAGLDIFKKAEMRNDRTYCCVPQCKSQGTKNPDLSFHQFPLDTSKISIKLLDGTKVLVPRKIEWIRALRIRKKVSSRAKVCSKHFTPGDYIFPADTSLRPRLRPTAVPSCFLPVESVGLNDNRNLKTNQSAERQAHCEKHTGDKQRIVDSETGEEFPEKDVSPDDDNDDDDNDIEINDVRSVSNAGDFSDGEMDTTDGSIIGSLSKPLKIERREEAFGKLVACEMSDLCRNPELYLKTKQAILNVLVQARFDQMKQNGEIL